MINPEAIDLSALPFVGLEHRFDLPKAAGIYFAIDEVGTVQYIGKAANII